MIDASFGGLALDQLNIFAIDQKQDDFLNSFVNLLPTFFVFDSKQTSKAGCTAFQCRL